jgi:hypothetical protein
MKANIYKIHKGKKVSEYHYYDPANNLIKFKSVEDMLTYSAEHNDLNMMKLVFSKFDITNKDNLLLCAVKNYDIDMVKYLVEVHNCKFDYRPSGDNQFETHPLLYLFNHCYNENYEEEIKKTDWLFSLGLFDWDEDWRTILLYLLDRIESVNFLSENYGCKELVYGMITAHKISLLSCQEIWLEIMTKKSIMRSKYWNEIFIYLTHFKHFDGMNDLLELLRIEYMEMVNKTFSD